MAVVVSRSNCVAAVDLNLYFREYPDHLFCKQSFENLPTQQLEGVNEDGLSSSSYSMKFLQPSFQTDSSRGKDNKSAEERRWKNIHLGDLEERGNLDCKHVTGSQVLFTASSESEGLTLVLWDLVTQDVTQSCVGKNSFFVEYTREEPLWLVLSETGLFLFLFGFTQEEFLNRLIIYGSASTVDSLCRLNRWGRCSIPVHALE
ncbi:spatacsin-like, partial [Notechis scutatus]|uniref:Spatacsin-like n=1 Tax=Notechis scutatus TaxID=8663 RepID=A0A6J1W9S4_9SAUR